MESEFYVGSFTSEDLTVDSTHFAGLTLEAILPELKTVFDIDEDADVFLVNGVRVSLTDHPLEYGDHVEIIHGGKARERGGVVDDVVDKRPGPRLTVDVARNEATLDGITYKIRHWEERFVLDALVKANGIPITRNQMKQMHSELEPCPHLERWVKEYLQRDLPEIAELVQSSEGGYWIPAEYLG